MDLGCFCEELGLKNVEARKCTFSFKSHSVRRVPPPARSKSVGNKVLMKQDLSCVCVCARGCVHDRPT